MDEFEDWNEKPMSKISWIDEAIESITIIPSSSSILSNRKGKKILSEF
jgi:hypothetical protein